jgi:hypothetical protein
MRRRLAITTAAAAALCAAFVTGAAAEAGPGAHVAAPRGTNGVWSTAEEVPGTAPLNVGGQASVAAISCISGRYCGAGGFYASSVSENITTPQAFVESKVNGVWGNAEEVPNSGTLNADGNAKTNTISCTAVGDCLAAGWYTDANDIRQAWVATETNGTWGDAEQLPGSSTLNVAVPGATISSVVCNTTGNCTAAGWYTNAGHHVQVMVDSETGGTWGTPEEIPGSAALNAGGQAQVNSMSCPSQGNCSLGGYYASSTADGIPITQAFVATETDGTWGDAEEVPGTAALNGGGYAVVTWVSCPSAGNCGAGGEYTNSSQLTEAFVVNESDGTWGNAEEAPGSQTLNASGLAELTSGACPAVGDCSAGGYYLDGSFNTQAFVVNESGGTWGNAEEAPGTAALDQGVPGAEINAVACAAVGACTAGGFYSDANEHKQAFVINENGGTWGNAEEVPGSGSLNVGGSAATNAVGCTPGSLCSAGGSYTNAQSVAEAFIVKENSG